MTTDYNNMTKDQIIELMKKNEEKLTKLENQKGKGLKVKISELIDQGYNTIEELSEELDTTKKNISSYLTYLRNDLKSEGQWIVSSKIGDYTWISKVNLTDLGWTIK